VLVLLVVLLSARKEGYAPPRDENTQPPYTENLGNVATTSNNLPYVESMSNVVRVDNQSQIYKDMGGLDFQLQSGNPILEFIQGDPSSNVIYGDFVPNESDGGSARMYAYEDREMIAPVPETVQQPSDTLTVSVNASLEPIPENPTTMKTVSGVDVNGNIFNPPGNLPSATSNVFTIQGVDVRGDLFDVYGNKFADTDVTTRNDANQYIPELTSFAIPFLGDVLSASESPASTTSPAVTQ
jgi:hypothetical protein